LEDGAIGDRVEGGGHLDTLRPLGGIEASGLGIDYEDFHASTSSRWKPHIGRLSAVYAIGLL
jgi:hypothetical protein